MRRPSFLLTAGLTLCLGLAWSPAEARVCGATEQRVLEEVEGELRPVANGETGSMALTSSQELAELRLSGLRSCDGMVGLRAGVLSLKMRFVKGELHRLLPEMESYLRTLEAEDGGGSLLKDFELFAERVASSDRMASTIELVGYAASGRRLQDLSLIHI